MAIAPPVNPDPADLQRNMRANILLYLAAAAKAGFKVQIGEARRTVQRQQYLYSLNSPIRWMTNCDGVRAISMHQYGLAVDLLLLLPSGKANWDSRAWRTLYAQVPPSKYGLENIPQELLHVQLAGSQAQVRGAGVLSPAYVKRLGLVRS